MPDLDLATKVRDYALGKGRASVVVSSAWLAREFDVDPRTIAAALRPYGVAPGEVERGIRGYSIAELAGMVLPEAEPPDVLEGRIPTEASAVPDDLANHWSSHMTPEEQVARPPSCVFPTHEAITREMPAGWPDAEEQDAITRLSAGAGHDMTPALRAAGLL